MPNILRYTKSYFIVSNQLYLYIAPRILVPLIRWVERVTFCYSCFHAVIMSVILLNVLMRSQIWGALIK